MSTQPKNALIELTAPPDDAELAQALGAVKPVWDQLIASLGYEQGATILEWRSHSPKYGWSLRLMRGKRTIAWFSPSRNCFTVLSILGGKAMAASRQGKLTATELKLLDAAPEYPEGYGIRIAVKGPRPIPTIKKLTEVKRRN